MLSGFFVHHCGDRQLKPLTMRKTSFLLTWLFLQLVLASGAQTILHRASVNVQLTAENAIVTEVRDITPGGVDEGFIPISDNHMVKKFIMNVGFDSENYFQRLEWWKSSVSSKEKQGKCGRKWVDDHHARFCWGIDPVNRRKYFISYPLVNLLRNDGKNDVLDYDFLDLTGQAPAQMAEVRLYLKEGALTEKDLDLSRSSEQMNYSFSDGQLVVTPKTDGKVSNMPLHLAFRSGLFDGIPSSSEMPPTARVMSGNTGDWAEGDLAMAFSIPEEELHSPMMNDNRPKTESGGSTLLEYIYAYPKTTAVIGCLLVVLLALLYRGINILRLKAQARKEGIGNTAATSLRTVAIGVMVLWAANGYAQLYNDDIHVIINDLGNARICESRRVSIYQGTEGFIKMYDLQGRDIGELAVTDEQGREFKNITPWKVNATFEEKAYKCGIYKADEGDELCWGIGEYGNHIHHIRYTLTRLVKAYDDYDGFIFTFYQAANPYAKHMRVTIEGDGKTFTPENTRVWSFRHYGTIYVKDGKVEVETTQPFQDTEEKMTVMVQFNKGMFHPTTTVKKSFYEAVKRKALRGSEYLDTEEMDRQNGKSSLSGLGSSGSSFWD